MNRRLEAFFLIFLIGISGIALAEVVKVPDGTAVRLKTVTPLNSATNKNDDPIQFVVSEDVKVGDKVVIPKDTTAIGHVTDVEPRRRMGRAGKLDFAIDHVKAPDGTNIRLRATSARKGDDKTGTVIVGTVLVSPLFLIMRGKDVKIPAGTEFSAYVDGDREYGETTVAAASSPATVDTSTVEVRSNPDGADIAVDGKFMGATPSTLKLAAGDHHVVVSKGDKKWEKDITITAGGMVKLNADFGDPVGK